MSLISLELLFPVGSETTNLKCANVLTIHLTNF
jgi:hypothetical protein